MRRPEIRKENLVLAVDVSIIVESGRSKLSNLPFAKYKKGRKNCQCKSLKWLVVHFKRDSKGEICSLNCEIKLKFVAEISVFSFLG
jgi:hypothetical protein